MPTFNTTDPKPGYVYDSAIDTWFPLLGIAPGSSISRWRKTAAGSETSVTGLDDLGATLAYNAGTEQVYLNGVLLVRTEDYLATNGTSVTNLGALAASDVIEVISFDATNVQITDALLETDINAKGDLIVGAAVDTAAILSSGTNGQVLKVNTATATGLEWGTIDADIEGVTAGTGISGGGTSGTVTITNSMATAIDAKGDLIPGTGADTFARLVVGANETRLVADSSTATGLKYVADTTNYAVAAKGNLLVGTAADTLAALSVGTNGHTLVADSAEATGVKWAVPSSGMTLITRTAVSGAVAHNIDSVFDVNTYSTYRIVFEKGFAAPSQRLQWQLRYGSTTQTTGYYTASYGYKYTGIVLGNAAAANGSYFHMGGPGATNLSVLDLSILGNTAYYNGQITTNDDGTFFAGGYNQSMGGTISGLRLISAGGTDNISGTISIYGMAR